MTNCTSKNALQHTRTDNCVNSTEANAILPISAFRLFYCPTTRRATLSLGRTIMASTRPTDHLQLPSCLFSHYDLQFETSQTALTVTIEVNRDTPKAVK